jgi:hypothetical protein
MFVRGKLFNPSLMFVSKARVYLRLKHFSDALLGRALGLTHEHPTRLESLARDKRLAYYERS